ncbi:3-oxoacyl-reductase [Umbelopsis sp. PMI_123]|nr:3-oxoacyl-reductase [Umbelopsis sp. PMI_123]
MTTQLLQGKVAIITGGTRGIGEGIVKAFAEQGASIVVTFNTSEDQANSVVKKIKENGGQAISVQADLGDVSGPKKIVDETIKAFGKIDIIVNNAAITLMQPMDKAEAEDIDRLYQVNVRGAILLIKESSPHLQENGRIINISSASARYPVPGLYLYSATKAALQSLSRTWANEFGSKNITSNTVAPGPVLTDALLRLPDFFRDQVRLSLQNAAYKEIATIEDIVSVVVFLASPASQRITGDVLNTNGGFLYG